MRTHQNIPHGKSIPTIVHGTMVVDDNNITVLSLNNNYNIVIDSQNPTFVKMIPEQHTISELRTQNAGNRIYWFTMHFLYTIYFISDVLKKLSYMYILVS